MVYALHEHELREGVDETQYELEVSEAIKKIKIPGLLKAHHLKGFKGERNGRYAVLWVFESEESIAENFGTLEDPKWPEEWLHYENNVLTKFLDRHPNKINFTDYRIINMLTF